MKLRKKLLLSCAALAACATTMVSTTYAWYTSNTEVTAGNINGTTAASGSELLLISQDATNWFTAIENVNETATQLVPMQYNKGTDNTEQGTLGSMGSTKGSDGDGFVEFSLYLKNASTSAGNLKVQITEITNTTGATLPAKPVVGANHKYIGIAASNSTYTVDMMRALCMEIEVYNNTQGAPTTWNLRTDNVYELEQHATLKDDSLKGSTASTSAIGDTDADKTGKFSAHQYYNAVMTENIALTDSTVFGTWDKNSKLDLGTLPTAGTAATNNTYLKVTFKLFLNGWDLACFDACQGQTFKLGLKFTAEATQSQSQS